MIGNVTVRENDGIITVEGIPADVIARDIRALWETDRVNQNMFLDIGTSSFSFLSFYATDVLFTLHQITNTAHSLKVSINTLTKIKDRLLEFTWLSRTVGDAPRILDRSKLKDLVFDPLDFQAAFFDFYEDNKYKYNLKGFLLAACAGSGKSTPLDSLIKIPNGWARMGDMQVGTEVIAKDGTTTKVTAIYPQGVLEIFKITFADGRSTECCGNHLWSITRTKHHDLNYREVVNTKQLIEYLKLPSLCNRLYIDLVDSEKNSDVELPIDPYLLGECTVIPNEYLHASTKQRLSLLQGILDTSGAVRDDRYVLFKTPNEKLALDVQYLVRSLGGIAIMITEPDGCYKLSIRYKKPSELFRSDKSHLFDYNSGETNGLMLGIISIESIGYKEAQCISIEHPDHLYVTDHFIVTHNTYTSLALTNMLPLDNIIIVCPKAALIKVWEESIKTLFHQKQTYWISSSGNEPKGNERFYVVHYEALVKMLDYSKKLMNKRVAVILDESHNLNEVTSMRSNNFVELCETVRSKDTVWLSGTPFKAMAIEAIPLLRAIDPLFTKEVEGSFKKIFGKNCNRAVEILNNRLGLVTFKVEKKELKLVPPIFSDIKVKMPNSKNYTISAIRVLMKEFVADRKEYYDSRKKEDERVFYGTLDYHRGMLRARPDIDMYNLYRQNLVVVIRSGGDYSAKEEIMFCNRYEATKILPSLPQDKKAAFRDVKSIVKYVNLKIQGEALGRVFGAMRTQCHVDMVNYIDFKSICESTVKKTVVFTSFVQVVEKAQKFLTEAGMSPLVVYGKTNVNLASIVSSFEKEEILNPLIATYKSLSTAVPLVMADTMVLVDSPFRDYIRDQSISRIHRIGSTTQVYVYSCSLDTGEEMNISTRSLEILSTCQQFVEDLIGIRSPYALTGDNAEEFTIAIEGLDCVTLDSVKDLKPAFLSW